jgi:RNA polymerase sigma factor for flagellar operon FliA
MLSMSRQELMKKYLGLVKALAWKIHRKLPSHVDVDELVGYGHLGLAEAARSFDESRGLKFSTFAYHRIRGAIFDGLGEMNWFKASDYHAGVYEKTAEEPKSNDPTPRRDLASRRSMVMSLAQIEADQGDTLSDPGARAPGAKMEQAEMETKVWELVRTLPAQTQQLIRWVYFDGLTLKEVAERMGHDKSWASRLHASALRHLQHAIEHPP